MAFFLIVPSVIIVSIFLIHALAKRLGLRIYYTTLAAAAVLSFMANYAATLWSPAVGKDFLLRLGLIILAASLSLTFANRFLIKQQRAEEKNFHEEVKAAYEAEVNKESPPPPPPIEKFEWEENPPPKYNESVPADEPAAVEEPEVAEAPAESPQAEPVKESKPLEKFPLEKVFEPLSEVKHEEAKPPVEEPEDKFPLEEVFKPLAEVKHEEAKPPPPKPADLFPLQEVFQPLSTLKLDKLETLPAEEPTPANTETEEAPSEASEENADSLDETLDDILDKAYNEREKGHIWQAIELYKKALERYRNDEYAPFVAIDLGNIYKEQALYSKAIKIYEEALTLPTVTRNPSIKKEFVTNLEYLRIVRDVLLKYHALSKPFAKLSQEILQEIDSEFQKAQRKF